MKTLIKTLLWLLTIIIGLLLILTIYFCFAKDKSVFGFSSYINTGTSMLPLIDVGDLLIVKKCDSYIKGDIITFEGEKNFIVTHRVFDKKNDSYITKGDNNTFVDNNKVYLSNIKGKVVFKIKGVGVLLNYFLDNKLTIVIGLLVLVIIGMVLKYVC